MLDVQELVDLWVHRQRTRPILIPKWSCTSWRLHVFASIQWLLSITVFQCLAVSSELTRIVVPSSKQSSIIVRERLPEAAATSFLQPFFRAHTAQGTSMRSSDSSLPWGLACTMAVAVLATMYRFRAPGIPWAWYLSAFQKMHQRHSLNPPCCQWQCWTRVVQSRNPASQSWHIRGALCFGAAPAHALLRSRASLEPPHIPLLHQDQLGHQRGSAAFLSFFETSSKSIAAQARASGRASTRP